MDIITQPFHDQLDTLQKYLELKIFLCDHGVWVNLQVCEDSYYLKQGKPIPKERWVPLPLKTTFEEFYTRTIFNAQRL